MRSIAAAVKGSGIAVADKWAEATRESWEACNLRKGYMYMVDCMTDPRWQRSYGTFGEDPALICQIAEHIIPRIQGSEEGVTDTGVAVTTVQKADPVQVETIVSMICLPSFEQADQVYIMDIAAG